jgi:hypothetical protein
MFSVSSSLCKIHRSFTGSVFGDGLVKIRRSSGSAGRERVTADFLFFFGFGRRPIVKIPQGLKMYKFALLPVEKREESLRASSHVFFGGITNGRE